MYLRQSPNSDKPYQVVQFMSFRKKINQQTVYTSNNKITFHSDRQAPSVLTILAIYQFTAGTLINQEIFSNISFQHCPKLYQTYTHQKTIKALLKVIIDDSNSQNGLVSLIDQFPIMGFVLQAYSRAACIKYLKNHKNIILYGNEQQILQDFSLQIRGNLLDVMADALAVHITLVCGQFTQFYGQNSHKRKVSIKYTDNWVQAELISQKKQPFPLHFIRTNEKSVSKNLKQINSLSTQTSQSQLISSVDCSSLLKDNIATSEISRCDKCKLLKNRCFCSKKTISTYDTPKSASKNQGTTVQPNSYANIFSVSNHNRCVCQKFLCTCRN